MVEGKCAIVVQDMPRHIAEIPDYVMSLDPEHPNPLRTRLCVTLGILRHLLGMVMKAVVRLHSEPDRGAVEIQHKSPTGCCSQRDFGCAKARRNSRACATLLPFGCLAPIPLHHLLRKRSPSPSPDGEDRASLTPLREGLPS
jgi:hypothetical protein